MSSTWEQATETVAAATLTAAVIAVLCAPPGRRLVRDRLGVRDDRHRPLLSELLRHARRTFRSQRRYRSGATSGAIPREAYSVLGAELRAGRSAEDALATAATVAPLLQPAVHAVRTGADVPAALRAIGPNGRALALAWAVAEQSGIGLAPIVDRAADGLAFEEEIRSEVDAQLAGPRATARMLVGLPVVGLVLGGGLGAPFGYLLGTWTGIACLTVGGVLAGTGLWWVERLAKRAEI